MNSKPSLFHSFHAAILLQLDNLDSSSLANLDWQCGIRSTEVSGWEQTARLLRPRQHRSIKTELCTRYSEAVDTVAKRVLVHTVRRSEGGMQQQLAIWYVRSATSPYTTRDYSTPLSKQARGDCTNGQKYGTTAGLGGRLSYTVGGRLWSQGI